MATTGQHLLSQMAEGTSSAASSGLSSSAQLSKEAAAAASSLAKISTLTGNLGLGRRTGGTALAKARRDLGVALNATARADAAASKSAGLPTSVEVRVADAANTGFEPRSFDTVVDTFGLCSFEDPVAALREMSRVCRKGFTKKNARGAVDDESAPPGKIYLLEHGRSDWAWLSNILDRHADPHAKRWGCYWNRDILAIVREAGLEIESVARYHLGTTYVIVAAPPRRQR